MAALGHMFEISFKNSRLRNIKSWPRKKKVVFTNFVYCNKMRIKWVYKEAGWSSIKPSDLP